MGINVGFLTTSSYVDPTGFPRGGKYFLFAQNKPEMSAGRWCTDRALQYVLRYVSGKILPLARADCRQGIIWEGIEINVMETTSTSRVECLLLFLSGPCCRKIKVKLPAIVGGESFHLGDRINILLSPTEQFVIKHMWSEEAHEVTIEC